MKMALMIAVLSFLVMQPASSNDQMLQFFNQEIETRLGFETFENLLDRSDRPHVKRLTDLAETLRETSGADFGPKGSFSVVGVKREFGSVERAAMESGRH